MASGAESAEWRAELGRVFLARLARLGELRRAWDARLETPPPVLLERALLSTYEDCARLGVRRQARELLGLADDPDEDCRGIRSSSPR